MEYSLLAYRPSQMAAAACLLTMSYFNQPADIGWVGVGSALNLAPLLLHPKEVAVWCQL